ncbi:MAG: tetratricopeptide repeat protein [Ignavibacteriales bacterium]|nr:MAG: tetratricopeptide repeat protein [Ignavibacteriales bacterium]
MKEDFTELENEYKSLKSKLSEDGNNLTLLEKFAEVCCKLKKYKEAKEIYERLIKDQPKTSKYNYRLGKVLFELEKYNEALEQQNIAIEKWNNFQWAKYEKIKCLIALNKLNDVTELFTEFDSVIDGKGTDLILQKAITRLKFDLLFDIGEYGKAIELADKLTKLEPEDGFIPYKCGKIFLEQTQFEQALEKFQLADELLKKNYVKDKIAITLGHLEKLNEAAEIYKSIPFHQMDDYICQHYGRLLYKMERYEDAKQQLKYAVLKKGKSEFKSHYHLGLVYEKLKKYKNALQEFNIAQHLRKEQYKVDYSEALQKIETIKKNNVIDENELLEEYENFRKGIIVKYNSDRGFGFIKDTDTQQYFFHVKNCRYKDPKVGDNVKYFLVDGKKGKEANNVMIKKD